MSSGDSAIRMVTPAESFMGVNLPADIQLRTIHHTDYFPLLKSDVIIFIQNI
jgi:hypothetical protein